MSDESRIRHIYEEWHRTVMSRDLAGLMVLRAEHAVFESPTVVAQFPDRADGVLRGRSEIEKLFARNFTTLPPSSATSIAQAFSPTVGF
jgi:steroid delta-isomerase